MSDEIRSQKTRIWVLNGAVLLAIGNITNLGEIGGDANPLDTTNLDSDAKESIPGLVDNGQLQISVNLANIESHKFLDSNKGKADRFPFYIGLEAGDLEPAIAANAITPIDDVVGFGFAAGVLSFKPNVGGVDGIVTASATLTISGAVTTTWPA